MIRSPNLSPHQRRAVVGGIGAGMSSLFPNLFLGITYTIILYISQLLTYSAGALYCSPRLHGFQYIIHLDWGFPYPISI